MTITVDMLGDERTMSACVPVDRIDIIGDVGPEACSKNQRMLTEVESVDVVFKLVTPASQTCFYGEVTLSVMERRNGGDDYKIVGVYNDQAIEGWYNPVTRRGWFRRSN